MISDGKRLTLKWEHENGDQHAVKGVEKTLTALFAIMSGFCDIQRAWRKCSPPGKIVWVELIGPTGSVRAGREEPI